MNDLNIYREYTNDLSLVAVSGEAKQVLDPTRHDVVLVPHNMSEQDFNRLLSDNWVSYHLRGREYRASLSETVIAQLEKNDKVRVLRTADAGYDQHHENGRIPPDLPLHVRAYTARPRRDY